MKKNLSIIPTKVYYLKMGKKPNINSTVIENTKLSKLPLPITTESYLHYYQAVGEKYNWIDRLVMEKPKLYNLINATKTEIFVYKVSENIAGFAEFVREKNYTEILYFGLFPEYIGKGLGKDFLQKVIHESWNHQQEWVQLNTCELDHPNALSTYEKSGFKIDKVVVEDRKVYK